MEEVICEITGEGCPHAYVTENGVRMVCSMCDVYAHFATFMQEQEENRNEEDNAGH